MRINRIRIEKPKNGDFAMRMPGYAALPRVAQFAALALAAIPATALGQAAEDATQAPAVALPQIEINAAGRVDAASRATTATRTDTPIIDVPQSITVVPREQIDAQNAQTVGQALGYVAGVVSEPRPGRYDSIIIRGFGGFGNSANYVTFLDGLRLLRGQSFAIASVDPWLLNSIEVLRGPSGVLFGQVNPGGIVNMSSRLPSANPVNEMFLESGSYDRLQAGITMGGRLDAEGRFTYSLTGLGRITGTQWDDVMDQRIAIAPAVTWRPTDNTTITLLGSYQYDPESGYYNGVPYYSVTNPGVRSRLNANFNPGDPAYDNFSRTNIMAGWRFEQRFDDTFSFRQNFRYQSLSTHFQAVSASTSAAAIATLNRTGVLTRSASVSDENVDGLGVDNQLIAALTTGPLQHTVLVGLDYQYAESSRSLGSGGTAPALNVFAPVYNQMIARPRYTAISDQTQSQLGLYAQDQIRWGGLNLLLGLRQDWFDQETTQRLTSSRTSLDDNHLSWRIGVVYETPIGIAPYASYATSFEPVTGTYAPQRGGAGFVPTEAAQYEVGVRYQPPDRSMLLTLSAFDITQTNVLTADPAYSNYNVQSGEVESRGIELEGRFVPMPGMNLILTYTYLDAKVTQSNDVPVGNRPVGVPNQIASGWIDYSFTEGTPLNGLTLGGGVRYVGTSYGDAANTFKVDGYTLVDAMFRYDLGTVAPTLRGLQATLNVNNLFDKQYIAACSSDVGCYYGTRRSVIAGVHYRW